MLIETRRKILDAASSLSLEQQDEVLLGIWSVKDLLAHPAGWDVTNIDDERVHNTQIEEFKSRE